MNQENMKLNICSACIYSACNGNQSNKCNVNEMTCTQDNNQLVIAKANNVNETCPMSFWDITKSTHTSHAQSSGKSCGCGR